MQGTEERLLNVQEVSFMSGISVQTVGLWYRWKKENPDHELAKLLPDYTRAGNKHTRYWKVSDVQALIEFKKALPLGRNGIMGSITQKYVPTNFRNKNKGV